MWDLTDTGWHQKRPAQVSRYTEMAHVGGEWDPYAQLMYGTQPAPKDKVGRI